MTNANQYCEKERQRLDKWQKFQLPNFYKKMGIALFVLSMLTLLLSGLLMADATVFKIFAKKGMLLALLIVSVSKDKIEDELTINLRSKSYSIAFVIVVVYALIQPFVNYLVAAILTSDGRGYSEVSAFEVIWSMLFIHLGIFYLLKRTR